jgi:hypothetical protein
MVAYAPYVAATGTLSSAYHAVTPSEFYTAPTCQIVTATVTEYAAAYPTTNPHGHGGPYYNPHNDVDFPFEWPGKPCDGQEYPGEWPKTPYEYGGPAKGEYEEPCWIPKGTDKLTPGLPKGEQCGNSQWGEIDCPHLPVDGLPSDGYQPGYPHYPVNNGTGYPTGHPTGYPTATPTADPACPTMPDTGVTRTYELHVAYQTIAPDGVQRNGLTFNGQYPGPLVEANWYVNFRIKSCSLANNA